MENIIWKIITLAIGYFRIGIIFTIILLVINCFGCVFETDETVYNKYFIKFSEKCIMDKTKEILNYIFLWPIVIVFMIISVIIETKKYIKEKNEES